VEEIMTKRLTLLLIFLTSLTFYLSFNAYIPVTDPVESNYALTAKEMLLSGDWLSPQIYGHYWFDKPIMIYWLIALSFKFLGITDFAARFPAGLFSAASVTFTYWFGQKIFNNGKIALLSALVLATSLEFWLLAKMIITDSVLFFYTSISLAMLYLGLKTTPSGWYVIFAYIAAAFAVLTKGPVGLVLPGLIVCSFIVFTRQWQLFKKIFILPGYLAFLVIAAPWYIKMYQIHGQYFVDTFLGLHNYLRATVSEHPKDNVFYYYLVLFPISLLPWAGVLINSINIVRKETRSSQLIYLANWSVITIIFYTMMATKYPTYVFPAAFPAALLIGYTLGKMQTLQGRKIWYLLSIPTIALLGIIAFSGNFLLAAVNWTFIYIGVIISILLLLLIQYKGNVHHMPQVVALVTVIMSLLLIHNGLIPLAEIRSDKNIVSMLPEQDAKIASYGDYSTSAVFYSGYYIPKLVNQEDNQPQGVWSGKYTMPTETIKAFNSYERSYILVKNNEKESFVNEPFAKQFSPIVSDSTTTLYQRVIP
jgi:4-amino-4-deoxy-L-arabinose transferase-like glycosyltransferase